ncbi:MAG: phosphoribosylglycinamide formyltransferase [Rhodospirillales bacterium]
MKVAVLISGRGSNLQALIDAEAEIVLVISNVESAQGLERAAKAGIPTIVINHKDFDGRQPFDAAMTEAIEAGDADLVCLAGFMRILSNDFIAHWRDRLINIHPSLLPAYKGLNVQQRVLDAGEAQAGCSVHFVRPEMDTGPIILQAKIPVMADDDADKLASRILEQEHIIYPEALRLIVEGRVTIENERAVIDGAPTDAPDNFA